MLKKIISLAALVIILYGATILTCELGVKITGGVFIILGGIQILNIATEK